MKQMTEESVEKGDRCQYVLNYEGIYTFILTRNDYRR